MQLVKWLSLALIPATGLIALMVALPMMLNNFYAWQFSHQHNKVEQLMVWQPDLIRKIASVEHHGGNSDGCRFIAIWIYRLPNIPSHEFNHIEIRAKAIQFDVAREPSTASKIDIQTFRTNELFVVQIIDDGYGGYAPSLDLRCY